MGTSSSWLKSSLARPLRPSELSRRRRTRMLPAWRSVFQMRMSRMPMRCTSRAAKRDAPISLVSQSWFTYSCNRAPCNRSELAHAAVLMLKSHAEPNAASYSKFLDPPPFSAASGRCLLKHQPEQPDLKVDWYARASRVRTRGTQQDHRQSLISSGVSQPPQEDSRLNTIPPHSVKRQSAQYEALPEGFPIW